MKVILNHLGDYFKNDKAGRKQPRVHYEKGHVFRNVTVVEDAHFVHCYSIVFKDGSIMPDMLPSAIKIFSSDDE